VASPNFSLQTLNAFLVGMNFIDIIDFLCSMLVLHHFLHVLFTLGGVFMQFPELTY
jgi:hypothetical protein